MALFTLPNETIKSQMKNQLSNLNFHEDNVQYTGSFNYILLVGKSFPHLDWFDYLNFGIIIFYLIILVVTVYPGDLSTFLHRRTR